MFSDFIRKIEKRVKDVVCITVYKERINYVNSCYYFLWTGPYNRSIRFNLSDSEPRQ